MQLKVVVPAGEIWSCGSHLGSMKRDTQGKDAEDNSTKMKRTWVLHHALAESADPGASLLGPSWGVS
jgi:hypothetical protein